MAFRLRVPEDVKKGIEKIAGLDDALLENLYQTLQEEKPVLNPADLAKAIKTRLDNLSSDEANEIFLSLISLSSARHYYHATSQDVAKAAFDSLDAEVPNDKRIYLEEILSRLLQSESIVITSKALEVQQSQSHVFRRSSIVTDVRPIFLDDAETTPPAALIIHSLVISYSQDDRRNDFFVAMDDIDLSHLQDQIDRAKKKSESIKSMLNASQTLYLEVNNDDTT